MKRHVLGALLYTCLATAMPAFAGPIVVDAGWYGFCFGESGSGAYAGGCQGMGVGETGNPFTFSSPGSVLLKITDAYLRGDSFLVDIDAGSITFTTPAVASGPFGVSDPDLAFADPSYSHASIVLGPGSHSVNVFAASSPFGSGGAYLEVESAGGVVPEPASFVLLGAGLMTMALLRRKSLRHGLS